MIPNQYEQEFPELGGLSEESQKALLEAIASGAVDADEQDADDITELPAGDADADADADQEDDAPPAAVVTKPAKDKTVPLAALHEARGQNKELRAELEQLRKEFEQTKAVPAPAPVVAPQPQVNSVPQGPAEPDAAVIEQEALRRFKLQTGKDFDSELPTAQELVAMNIITNNTIRDAQIYLKAQYEQQVEQAKQQAEQAKYAAAQAQITQRVSTFWQTEQAQPTFAAQQEAFRARINAMSVDDRDDLMDAIQRLDSNQGTRADLRLFSTEWAASKIATPTQQPDTPRTAAPSGASKKTFIDNAGKLPRAAQLSSGGDPKTMTLDDVIGMIERGETIPAHIEQMLQSGFLT